MRTTHASSKCLTGNDRVLCVPIFRHRGNFEFLETNLPKKGLWSQNFKNQSLDLESGSLRYYAYQFSDMRDNIEFFDLNLSKNGFWSRNFKDFLSLDSESTPPIYHVCQFSVKVNIFKFFDQNLGKLSNYVQYFGSNIVEGVAESWLEAEMS